MRRPSFFIPYGILLVVQTALHAQSLEVPHLDAHVNDTAGILSPSTNNTLEILLKSHEDSTSNQVAVLTIPSLQGENLETYSMRVAESWQLGQKDNDNGILLLIAKDDRKIRIEVGSGLEGDLPDVTCGIIIRNEIVPHFKNGDYDGGVIAGVNAILGAIQGAYVAETPPTGETLDILGSIIFFLLFLVVVGLFTMAALFAAGFASWILYVFLSPFWFLFPTTLLGKTVGLMVFSVYAVGFVFIKIWLVASKKGKAFRTNLQFGDAGVGSAGSKRRSSGRSYSRSSSSYLGGGGSFSGGGASGSW